MSLVGVQKRRPVFPESITPLPTRKRLSSAERAEIVTAYLDQGATARELAVRFGASKICILDVLHRSGVTLRFQGLSNEQLEEAVRLYRVGDSCPTNGQQLGVAAGTVRRGLERSNVPLRQHGDH